MGGKVIIAVLRVYRFHFSCPLRYGMAQGVRPILIGHNAKQLTITVVTPRR